MLQLTTLPRRILDHPLGRRIALGSLGTLVVRGLGAVATVGSAALLARLLGPRDYGIYAYAVSWALLLGTIAGLGLDVLATREIAQARARGEPGTVRAFARWSARLVALTGSAAALLIAAVGLLVPDAWKPEAAAGLAWVAPAALAIAGLRLVQGLLQGSGRVVLSQALQPLVLPALLALLAGALHLGGALDARTALFAYTAAGFAALATGLPVLLRALPADAPAALPRPDWRRSARTFAAMNAASIANPQIGTVIVGTFAGPEEAGIFDLALRLSQLVPFALLAINAPLAPTMAELWARGEIASLRRLYRAAALAAGAAALAVTLGFVLLLPWFPVLFGPGYEALTWPLLILCAGQIVNAACGPVGSALAQLHQERYVFLTQTFLLFLAILIAPFAAQSGAFYVSVLYSLWLTSWNVFLVNKLMRILIVAQQS